MRPKGYLSVPRPLLLEACAVVELDLHVTVSKLEQNLRNPIYMYTVSYDCRTHLRLFIQIHVVRQARSHARGLPPGATS